MMSSKLMTMIMVFCMVISPMATLRAENVDTYITSEMNQPATNETPAYDYSKLEGMMPTMPVVVNGPLYASFTGTIVSINNDNGTVQVRVQHKEGGEAVFTLSPETILIDGIQLEVGATITGFYLSNTVLTSQYPARYEVLLVVDAKNEIPFVLADLFVKFASDSELLLNLGGSLMLNIGEKTEITDLDGNVYSGSLAGHKLVVYYARATFSFPAHTAPIRIIVLDPCPETAMDNSDTGTVATVEEKTENRYNFSEILSLLNCYLG